MKHALTPSDLRDFAINDTPLFVIDIETTGLNRGYNEIVEIGIFDYRTDEQWSVLVKPKRTSANWTTVVTGITDDDLADAPYIEEAFEILNEKIPLADSLAIAHNGHRFDFPWLNDAAIECGFAKSELFPKSRRIDSLNLARATIPWGLLEAHSLSALMKYFQVEATQDHRAGSDCFYTAHVIDQILSDEEVDSSILLEVEDLIHRSAKFSRPNDTDKMLRQRAKMLTLMAERPDLADRYELARADYISRCQSTYGKAPRI